jgi:hypothetical protein
MPGEKPLIDLISCEHVVFAEKGADGKVYEDRLVLDNVLNEIKGRVSPGEGIALEINPVSLWQCRAFLRLLEGKPADLPLPKNTSPEMKETLAKAMEKFSEMSREDLNVKITPSALFEARLIGELEKLGIKVHPVDSLMRAYIPRHFETEYRFNIESEKRSMFEAIGEKYIAKKIAKLAVGPEKVRLAVTGVYHVQNVSSELEKNGFRTEIHKPFLISYSMKEVEEVWLKRYVARQKNQWLKKQRRKKVFIMRFEGKLRKLALPKPRG